MFDLRLTAWLHHSHRPLLKDPTYPAQGSGRRVLERALAQIDGYWLRTTNATEALQSTKMQIEPLPIHRQDLAWREHLVGLDAH